MSEPTLEQKVDEHSLQIQELKDEVDFKKWKIDSLIEKIDNLTTVVQQIQLNQLKDDSDSKRFHSDLQHNHALYHHIVQSNHHMFPRKTLTHLN